MSISDEHWMQIALNEASKAFDAGEIPVGAIVVKDNKILSKAHNQSLKLNDPTAHAEILALRMASKKTNNYRLDKAILYVTLEPCIMCLGALYNARIYKIIYGAKNTRLNKNDSNKHIIISHHINAKGGILENECSEILKKFFRDKREFEANK